VSGLSEAVVANTPYVQGSDRAGQILGYVLVVVVAIVAFLAIWKLGPVVEAQGVGAAVLYPNPITLGWNANPPAENVIGYRLVVDQTVHDVGGALTFTETMLPGAHVAAVLAYNQDIAGPLSAPIIFSVFGSVPPDDPACVPPLGSHAPIVAPAKFITSGSGGPGSATLLSYSVSAPDPITLVAVQVDGVDVAPIGKGEDLRPFTQLKFTQPARGVHAMSLRVVTAFGCTLTRSAGSLTVQ
jgi:hypothetical protein